MGQFANLTNLPTQGVNLTNVTQAAAQSPNMQQGKGNSNAISTNTGGGNPNTSLVNAGQVSQMGKNFANYGAQNGQVSIPGPGGGGGGGGGPSLPMGGSGDANGNGGDPNNPLTNLKAIAAAGQLNPFQQSEYERLLKQEQGPPPPPLNFSNMPTIPPLAAPPPSPVASAQLNLPSASGATALPQGLSGNGAGVQGQSFNANTLMSDAVKGLQNVTSLPASVIGNLVQSLQNWGSSVFSEPTNPTLPTQKSTTQLKSEPNPGNPVPTPEQTPQNTPQQLLKTGLTGQPIHTGAGGFQDVGLSEFLSSLLPGGGLTNKQGGSMLKTELNPSGNSASGAYNQDTRQFGQGTDIGGFTPNQPGTPATMKNLSGNLQGNQAQSAVQAYMTGGAKLADVSAGIASPEGLQTVNKMAAQALKQGDMESVSRLATLHHAVEQQLNFITQVGQIVTALSAGFGTPNAPGITEQRTPMVEQGVGQSLESQFQPQFSQGAPGGSGAQLMPVRLPQFNETQQNKPILNPFMQ